MKTSLDCIPCILRQALDAARLVSMDTAVHEQIIRDVLRWAGEMDLNQTPPEIAQRIHRQLREITGVDDPYRQAKDRLNKLAGELDKFRQAIAKAQSILYLADNAGEIAFDRLLVEQLSSKHVTVVVRGAPVINDVTLVDARAVGLDKIVEVIANGSDAPGTILSDCNQEFRRRFADADLIIAKGQGNYETLSNEAGNIFFLFKVKCSVIADLIKQPLGMQVLTQSALAWNGSANIEVGANL